MFPILQRHRGSPIGVDIGRRSVKLLQFDADRKRLIDAVRWDIADAANEQGRDKRIIEALQHAREGRRFLGRDAVLCLNSDDLLIHNVRVPKGAPGELDKLVQQEAAGRVPFSMLETELRYIQAADVRQGDAMLREVILLACHRPVLERKVELLVSAGMRPIAVDVEPAALLRSYVSQFRREDDQIRRRMFVHVGGASTVAVIAQGSDVLFIKYIDIGGQHFDVAVASHLRMSIEAAAAVRRHNGDRRVEQQDPEIARSVAEATRPVLDRLAHELSLCIRYHSVTFRGQPLASAVIGGGEASQALVDALSTRINLKCELGDPLRSIEAAVNLSRKSQWDIAAGLALREVA